MGDKKHIDRIFQERFKDFEAAPSDAVWKNIEAELNKDKKKRRVIPLWWRYAGVAAVLLLMLTIGGVYFNNSSETHPSNVVDTEEHQTRSSQESNDIKIAVEANNSTETNTDKSNITEASSTNSTRSAETSIAGSASSTNKNVSENNSNQPSNNNSNTANSLSNLKNNNAITSNSEEKNTSNNNGIASNNLKQEQDVIQNKKPSNASEKTQVILNNASKETKAIAEVKKETPNKNLLTIEEALDKAEEKIADEKSSNKWRIAPNAAPVYFNTLGEGSSIDAQFNNNSKTGEFNMSYGINASYAVNDKLKVRSGINKVNLGYNTNNVIVYQSAGVSASTKALRNIDASSSTLASDNISIISGENFNAAPSSFETMNTSINQAFGYIEIPLEIEYALVNKKIGVNVIGGFSSFFLNENKIYSEAEGGSKTYLGEANNINNVSYSANFGLGLNYQVSKKIDLNIEPMFKYQINTFNNTSGDFKPYFIGVYTGFAIKF